VSVDTLVFNLATRVFTLAGPGTYSGSGSPSCAACLAGTYQPTAGQSGCLNCGERVLLTPASIGEVNAGRKVTAYWAAFNRQGFPWIVLADLGTYQPTAGQTSCRVADVGHFAPGTKSTAQMQCGAFNSCSRPLGPKLAARAFTRFISALCTCAHSNVLGCSTRHIPAEYLPKQLPQCLSGDVCASRRHGKHH